MTRKEADDAIEAKLDSVGNARNLINPDILRAMLSGIGLVIVPREPTRAMLEAVESNAAIQGGLDDCNQHDIPEKAWRLMIDAALDNPSQITPDRAGS
jgi:hypothetical protein